MMSHVEGLLASADSRLNEQNEFIHELTGKVESILDSLLQQAQEHMHTAKTAKVPNEETYQTPPMIFFNNDTPVKEGDEV